MNGPAFGAAVVLLEQAGASRSLVIGTFAESEQLSHLAGLILGNLPDLLGAPSQQSDRKARGNAGKEDSNEDVTRLYGGASVALAAMLLSLGSALAQQGCAWNKYLYAQDATQQGKIDTNLLNQMSAMVSGQGYSLTNKVWQLCSGWLMEAKRPNG